MTPQHLVSLILNHQGYLHFLYHLDNMSSVYCNHSFVRCFLQIFFHDYILSYFFLQFSSKFVGLTESLRAKPLKADCLFTDQLPTQLPKIINVHLRQKGRLIITLGYRRCPILNTFNVLVNDIKINTFSSYLHSLLIKLLMIKLQIN